MGFRESRNRTAVLARPNSRKLASPGSSKSGTGQDRLAHVSSQPLNIASRAGRRSQGATGTLAPRGYSNDDEYLHAGGPYSIARGEQQSGSFGAASAGGLTLMAPRGPSTIQKSLFTKEMLVGAVGIEFIKAQNLKELCGMCCSRKSFVVLGRNCCCPRIAPAFW